MQSNLSSSVEDFILKYIDSLEELEILLLLNASSERAFTVAAVYEHIKSTPLSVQQKLEDLTTKGLVQTTSDNPVQYRFEPQTEELILSVRDLAGAYKERRLRVLECLFSKPISSLRIFADSFKLRKDSKHG